MDDYTLEERRFSALAARPKRLAARLSASVVSLLGHAALLGLALFVVRPPAPRPPQPPEREVLVVRPPRPVPAKLAVVTPVVAPVVADSIVTATPPAAPPAPAPAPAPASAPASASAGVSPRPPPPAPKPAPHPKVAARTPRQRLHDLEATPLPPQSSEQAATLLRAAQREAALQQAALGASAPAQPAAETRPAAESGPTPSEEKRAFTVTLAERIRTHWVLPEGSPRDPVLVALTVRLLGAGYRLDCRPGPGAAGDTARMACAAIAAADLPQLPQSLARDGTVLAARFVP